jgi:hypothetical protein
MRIRIGKAFLSELEHASLSAIDPENSEFHLYEIVTKKGRKIKTGLSVDVDPLELVELTKECEWFTFMYSPEGDQSPEERKMYSALRRQLNSLNRVGKQLEGAC